MVTPLTTTPSLSAACAAGAEAGRVGCLLGGILGLDRLALAQHEEVVVVPGPNQRVVVDVARAAVPSGKRTQ